MVDKYCNQCKQTKPTSAFGRCKTYKDGLTVYCSECTRKQRRQIREANPEHYKAYMREYNKRYTAGARGRYLKMKYNAKRRGIPFEISAMEFINWFNQQKLICDYCGTKLEEGRGSMLPNDLNIDRKDSNRGYVLDNMVISCRRCNDRKGDWLTYKQMKEIMRKYFNPL
jgi:5-methylcytosine-specific restriction endonuclease McrA